jgi:predicted Zn-dependent protease with MMP-like domain
MKREHFVKVVEEALDSLPQEFRSRIRNVAVLIEDMPQNQPSPQSGQQSGLLLGIFHGVPTCPSPKLKAHHAGSRSADSGERYDF